MRQGETDRHMSKIMENINGTFFSQSVFDQNILRENEVREKMAEGKGGLMLPRPVFFVHHLPDGSFAPGTLFVPNHGNHKVANDLQRLGERGERIHEVMIDEVEKHGIKSLADAMTYASQNGAELLARKQPAPPTDSNSQAISRNYLPPSKDRDVPRR